VLTPVWSNHWQCEGRVDLFTRYHPDLVYQCLHDGVAARAVTVADHAAAATPARRRTQQRRAVRAQVAPSRDASRNDNELERLAVGCGIGARVGPEPQLQDAAQCVGYVRARLVASLALGVRCGDR
jgi:hypothetical protein